LLLIYWGSFKKLKNLPKLWQQFKKKIFLKNIFKKYFCDPGPMSFIIKNFNRFFKYLDFYFILNRTNIGQKIHCGDEQFLQAPRNWQKCSALIGAGFF
jgi:hypothetical protein